MRKSSNNHYNNSGQLLTRSVQVRLYKNNRSGSEGITSDPTQRSSTEDVSTCTAAPGKVGTSGLTSPFFCAFALLDALPMLSSSFTSLTTFTSWTSFSPGATST